MKIFAGLKAFAKAGCGCTVIAMLCLVAAPHAAVASDLDAAIEAVRATNEEALSQELERRREARAGVTGSQQKPCQASRLCQFDDQTLSQAVRRTRPGGRVVYGADDRRDWYQINDPDIQRLASAAAAMFNSGQLEPAQPGSLKMNVKSLGEAYALCPGEKFAEQVSGPYCSGTLVRENVVLTAGHCVREISNNPEIEYISRVSFVFGYHVPHEGSPGQTTIPAAQVFRGDSVLGGELVGPNDRDWALVELDRPVPPEIARPVTTWREAPVIEGEGVFVIGYPSGLPLKYAPNAEVRDTEPAAHFVANLDTFGGNSGSGVYAADTHELIGVLVRGEADYEVDPIYSCRYVKECPTTGCRGEDVMRITLVPRP